MYLERLKLLAILNAAINLAHGVCYLSQAPKSKASYYAYFEAVDDVKK